MENSRKYVGQRYVPKIIGEWNQSETYEGLSIVTNEGNSYTSKKRVPIGVDISNEDYWVVTGNYNAQIETYRDEVKDTKDELTTMKVDLENDLNKINLKNWVSVTDYGADPTGINDSTQAFKQAVAESTTVYVPVGEYLISDTIRESTNGRALQIIGENQYNSIIKASPEMTDKPLIWLGNSEGHGNYRGLIENITLNGGGIDKGNIGIRWHEAGQSTTRDVRVMLCYIGIQALGMIHGIFEGNTMIQGCVKGLLLTKIPTGIPSSIDDITVTKSPLTLNTNTTKIRDIWFSSISQTALRVEGGLVEIDNCTFQGSTTGGADYDVVEIINANESKDYGGGPTMTNCWFEGGSYRYAIAVRNTRAATITDNFISGSESRNGSKEGGILISNSPSSKVLHNSIRGFFDRVPSEGRLDNGGIYVTANSLSSGSDISDNYLTKVSVNYYFENVQNPKSSKSRKAHWAVIEITEGVPRIVDASDDSFANVTAQGVGLYTIVYKSNRESTLNTFPIHIQTIGDINDVLVSNVYEQNIIYDRLIFKSLTGVNTDPKKIVVSYYSDLRAY